MQGASGPIRRTKKSAMNFGEGIEVFAEHPDSILLTSDTQKKLSVQFTAKDENAQTSHRGRVSVENCYPKGASAVYNIRDLHS